MDKDAVEPVHNLWASSTFLGSKTTQPLETYSRSEQTQPFGDQQDHPPTRGVGYLNRFQGCLLPYTNTGTVQEISEISCPGSDIPVQALAFDLSTAPMEFTVVAKKLKLMAIHKGIRIHQYLDD